LVFYLTFSDGQVDAGVGEPPERAHVQLTMSAETLDGLFQGLVDGRKAAMSGKIAFSGSITRGISLQVVQDDLSRVYSEARAHVLAGFSD
jgi:putative sterol carrier protein